MVNTEVNLAPANAGPRYDPITLAVVGHNEATTLARALRHCQDAAGPRDRVVFVDSASTDGSPGVAAEAGVECWPASLGKGNAIAEALRRCNTEWIVFFDGDIQASEHNIAAVLASECRQTDTAMVVGDFDDSNPGGILSNTWGIYEPLMAELFPEIGDSFGSKPLSGFRAVRIDVVPDLSMVPSDFGVEAFLNIAAGLDGRGVTVTKIGSFQGPFRYKPYMGVEIGAGVLDAAHRHGRIAGSARPQWDAWVLSVAEVVASFRGDAEDRERFLIDLEAARQRPFPSAS